VRWCLLLLALLCSTRAQALDTHDRLVLQLDGGEELIGWFVRAEPDAVIVSVAGIGTPTRVSLDLISAVERDGVPQSLADFRSELIQAHQAWRTWVLRPPPQPHPVAVAVSSLVIPGAGQALLHESSRAWGYGVADLIFVAAGAAEMSSQQRLGVLFPLVGLSAMMRISSAAEAVRTTRRRRRRLRDARAILNASTEG
jgi:hypothetical protein